MTRNFSKLYEEYYARLGKETMKGKSKCERRTLARATVVLIKEKGEEKI